MIEILPDLASAPYTHRVDLSKVVAGAATSPVRAGLAAAEAGLAMTSLALGYVRQSLRAQQDGSLNDLIPLRDTMVGAALVAEMTAEDTPMGRLLATGGAADRLTRPGGIVDLLSEQGGLVDRLTANGPALKRFLGPGGLLNRIFAENGPIERLFAEDGPIERAASGDGILDKLVAKDGPLDQIAETAESLSRLQPAIETLTPAAHTIETAVDRLNKVVATLASIGDRMPWRRGAADESDAPDPN